MSPNLTSADEPLVLRSLPGSKGYLKIPKSFQKKYMDGMNASGKDAKGKKTMTPLPNPRAFVRQQDGKVSLIYQWDAKELNQ